MDFEEVVYKRRTIRRFKNKEVPLEILKKLIDYARVAPMGNNIQYLEYMIVVKEDIRDQIFPCTAWAGSLPPEERVPEEGRRPMAYIIVLANRNVKKKTGHEVGAAVQNILLGAQENGLGACWMGSIERSKIRDLLSIPDTHDIEFVISLGFPDEKSVLETMENSMKYWKDDEGVMHVPKKGLDDVILRIV